MRESALRPKVIFSLMVLASSSLTFAFLNYLYFRFSSYEDPGGWGYVYDRGSPDLGMYLFCLFPYLPLLAPLALPKRFFFSKLFFSAGMAYLICSIIFEGATAWLPIEGDLDEMFLLSLLVKMVVITFVIFCFVFVVVRKRFEI